MDVATLLLSWHLSLSEKLNCEGPVAVGWVGKNSEVISYAVETPKTVRNISNSA